MNLVSLGTSGLRVGDMPVLAVRIADEDVFEAPWEEQRRNLAGNPRFALAGAQWSTQAGTTWEPAILNGRSAGLVTRGTGGNAIIAYGVGAQAGDFVSARMKLSAADEASVGLIVSAFFHDGAVDPSLAPSVVLPAVGQEVELLVIGTRAMTTNTHRLYITPGVAADAGKQVYVTDVMYEALPALGQPAGPFFDAAAVDTLVERTRWLGTPNASASVLEVIGSV